LLGEVIPYVPDSVIVDVDKLSWRGKPELYPGERPYIQKGTKCKVLEKVKTDINWYLVELEGGDTAYISAEQGYTK